MLTPADEMVYAREKRRKGADLETIGRLLKMEWSLTDAEVEQVLKAFFEEVEEQ